MKTIPFSLWFISFRTFAVSNDTADTCMKTIPEDVEKKLQMALRHIEESAAFNGICGKEFNEATSVKSLAAAAGLSDRRLRDYFKAYTGQRLVEYISERRAEYAARIFRLYPAVSKSQVAESMGFECRSGIYGLMRKNGVADIDSLRGSYSASKLPYRKEYLSGCVLFYSQIVTPYAECLTDEFEADNWDKIEAFVASRHPKAEILGYVGFAIDRYLTDDKESGTFISGIIYRGISSSGLQKDMIGRIGWRSVPSRRYAVFTHEGSYDGLTAFYEEVVATINHSDLKIDITTPYMEKYLNSPADTGAEELITELWVALSD